MTKFQKQIGFHGCDFRAVKHEFPQINPQTGNNRGWKSRILRRLQLDISEVGFGRGRVKSPVDAKFFAQSSTPQPPRFQKPRSDEKHSE